MVSAPTLYKARGVPTKQVVCAICLDRTRGRTVAVRYGYGVCVSLCAAHASAEFQTQRGGRDLVLTLHRTWQANGCLTAARSRALASHLAACTAHAERPRPGSYSWPDLRAQAERWFAAGATPSVVRRRFRLADGCPGRLPSARTVRRWHSQRRWIGTDDRAAPPGARAPRAPFDTIQRP